MKRLSFALLLISTWIVACDKISSHKTELKTDVQKSSYTIGHRIGQDMKNQGIDIDVDAMAAAIQDALNGKESRLTMPEMQQAMKTMNEKMMAKQAESGKDNKVKGDKFLEENKKNKDVKTTESGLQYEVLKAGNGPKPKDTDVVKVNYKGSLIDGTEFDSSYKRGEPAQFPVVGVIKGWTEALKLMPVGSKWKLVIPSQLAYGDSGRPSIPPSSVLVFEVELLDIVKNK